jgi:hypothetical protein
MLHSSPLDRALDQAQSNIHQLQSEKMMNIFMQELLALGFVPSEVEEEEFPYSQGDLFVEEDEKMRGQTQYVDGTWEQVRLSIDRGVFD